MSSLDTTTAREQIRASIRASIAQEGVGGNQVIGTLKGTAKPSRYNIVVPLTRGRALGFNTVTSAFAVWSDIDVVNYERLQREEVSLRAPELREFVAAGYLVPEDMDEVAEQEQRYNAVRFDAAHLTMTVAPTMACNFGCDYCFQGADKPSTMMPIEVQDAFLAYLEQKLAGIKSLHIAWYGGEPLLGLKVIESLSERIIALCKARKVAYSAFIVTNGYALDKHVARRLQACGVTSCQITLDGAAEYHDQRRALLSGRGTYTRILENIQGWINEIPIMVTTRVNIDERNLDGILGLLEDLAARGLAHRRNFGVYLAPVEAITDVCHGCSHVQMTKRSYAKLEVLLYRRAFELGLTGLPKPPTFHGNCQAIRPGGILLLPNGDIHKCWDTVHDAKHRVGTIFEPAKIPESPRFKAWIAWSPFKNDTCRNCRILPNCAGACAHKFVNPTITLGEAGALPCPSWKFNIVERLILRAEKMGVITQDDIIKGAGETSADIVGRNHTFESVAAYAAAH